MATSAIGKRNRPTRGHRQLTIQIGALLVTAIAASAGVLAAKQSRLWIAAIAAIVGSVLLQWLLPPLVGAWRFRQAQAKIHRAMRRSWLHFRREVEERDWLYAAHVHSYSSMVSSIRHTPALDERERLAVLQSDIASTAVLRRLWLSITPLANGPWPGEEVAASVICSFETLMRFPMMTGRISLIRAFRPYPGEEKAFVDWLERYRVSMESYERFARDQNALIGSPVYLRE